MKKIILFTHNDLDGYGCFILLKTSIGMRGDDVNLYTNFCGIDEVSNSIINFVESGSYKYYDEIIITDIAINQEAAEILDSVKDSIKIKLFDHHKTALWLNEKYEWATVYIKNEIAGRLTSATEILYQYLLTNNFLNQFDKRVMNQLSLLVTMIMRWDTWQWTDGIFNNKERDLNALFINESNKENFVLGIAKRIINNEGIITEDDENKINIYNNIKDKYINDNKSKFYECKFGNYNAALFINALYFSEFANTMAKDYPNIDIIMNYIPYSNKVELRTIKDNIDLSVLAKSMTDGKLTGGGHQKAAGFPVNKSVTSAILDSFIEAVERFSDVVTERGTTDIYIKNVIKIGEE